jgi:predicted permease
MADVNSQFLLSLVLIIVGYIIKKVNLISERDGEGLAKIILNITLPALILDTITTIEIDPALSLLPVIAVAYSFSLILLPFFLFRKQDRTMRGNLMICTVGFNIGLFAYPLIEGIFGSEGLTYIAMFDIGNAFVIFGLCYVVAVKFSPTEAQVNAKYIAKKLLTLIPLMSYVIALIINLSGGTFPDFVSGIFDFVGKANGPLVLILLGIYLNFSFERSHWKPLLKVLGIRYGIGLAVGLILFFVLPYALLFRVILLVSFIMPIGMAVVPYSVEFGYDRHLTGAMVNLSIMASFGLIWLILGLIPGT